MTISSAWQLHLLGHPQLLRPGAQAIPLARTALLTLTVLALDGRTSRARMAALLWPDTPEAAARNNLVHLLRRLRAQTGADLIVSDPDLELTDAVRTDVRAWLPGSLSPAQSGRPEPLLGGLDVGDNPELAEWLEAWRAQLERWQVEGLRREVTRLTQAGLLREALDSAGHWRAADPLSEEPWRTLMRLHHLNGDRAAALRVYRACEAAIRREFGSAPSPETRALAAELGRVDAPVPTARPKEFPLSVQRPPRLVGRDEAWARMEAAWAQGQLIFVSGEQGTGKTRLLQDFARAKGAELWIEGRPGDIGVPYSTLARIMRIYLRANPTQDFPPYMRREISRLLPELLGPDGAPPPIADDEAKGRFYTALGDAINLITQGGAVIMDDWQFNDDASQDFGVHYSARTYPLPPGEIGPLGLMAFQTGTLQPAAQTTMDSIMRGNLGIHIEVEPLDDHEVERLLVSLDLPGLSARARQLAHFTGGNPQFILETVRHLIEAGLLDEPAADLTLPPQLQTLLSRRLEPLTPTALQVAQAASVVQQDFTVELLSDLLGLPLMDVAGAWHELETRQVLRGEQFGHDLMRQAVAAALPEQTRRMLHRRAARTLERYGLDASRIAQHWAQGQDARQAALWYRRAAQAAQDAYRPEEAESFLASAHALESGHGTEEPS